MSEAGKSKTAARKQNGLGSLIRAEFSLLIGVVTAAIFLWSGSRLLETLEHPGVMGVVFAWLFVAVLWSAISVVRHADCLAIKCGEPYGTLILTLSAITIEVMMISAAMLHGENNPTLARDMMFAVIMIGLNGLIGLSLLLGGLRHHHVGPMRSTIYHAVMLILYLLVVIVLAEKFAIPLDNSIERFGMPQAFGGAIVAGLVLAPEALSGINAARKNQLQRSVNILHG